MSLLEQLQEADVAYKQFIHSISQKNEKTANSTAARDAAANEGVINLDPVPETTPAPTASASTRVFEGFLPVALRAHARGQRVLPIMPGAKNPAMAWKGSFIDTDNTEQWAEHSEQWIQECAAKFPNAGVCVIAKPFEYAFIDEDQSDEFRRGYEAFAGEPYPRTFTTQSRPDHRQSHWLQTDGTRALGNIPQGNGLSFSFRQNNLYVLSEGSPHPSGSFYDVFDSEAAVPMPDKLVAYMRSLRDHAAKPTATVSDLPNGHESSEPRPRLDDGVVYGTGERNNQLSRYLYHRWVLECCSEDELRHDAYAFNETKCKPSLDRTEVEQVIQRKLALEKKGTGLLHDGQLIAHLNPDAKTENKAEAVASAQPNTVVPVDVSNWRSKFRNIAEMEQGDPVMIIDGVLQEGTCFLGAAPSHGKTLVALAMAKAITLGTPLFELPQFPVKKTYPVLYLIPETSDRPFRKRCEAFRLPMDDRFLVRTITAGASLKLTDPDLLEAVRQRHFVVFLDTTRRFNESSDSNSDAQNQLLVTNVNELRAAGSPCVILLHHATKTATQKKETMTLENMLSGTGDFGAMCDQAYGIRKDEALYNRGAGALEIDIVNLKDRERLMGLTELRLAATYKKLGEPRPQSWIDETGNFRAVGDGETMERNSKMLVDLVKAHPDMTVTDLFEATGIKRYTIQQTLKGQCWHRTKGGPNGSSPWHQDVGGKCPYEKHGRSDKAAA
jgi:AAA domain/Bifunctional DNA primase/polymerase, N-terminal